MSFTSLQDSGRLGDFDYSDKDIDSLRKQMQLPEHDPRAHSPASSLSDELGALGALPAIPHVLAFLDHPKFLHRPRTSILSLPRLHFSATLSVDRQRNGVFQSTTPPSAKRTTTMTKRNDRLLLVSHASQWKRKRRTAARQQGREVASRSTA